MDAWAAKGKPAIFTDFGADNYPCVQGELVWNFADFKD